MKKLISLIRGLFAKAPEQKKDTGRVFYRMGYGDAVAVILAENKDKVRIPSAAQMYVDIYGHEHFSHAWHTAKEV